MNQRVLTVQLNYSGRDLSSLLADAQKQIAEKVSFDPAKYRLEWGGDYENQRRAEARLILIMALVLGLMTVLLYAAFGLLRQTLLILGVAFGLLRQTLLILGVVPLATLGGLIALHLTGNTSTSPRGSASSRCLAWLFLTELSWLRTSIVCASRVGRCSMRC